MATFKAEVQKQRRDGTFNVKIILTHNRKLKRLPTSIYITKEDMTRSGKIKNQKVLDELEDLMRRYRCKVNGLSLTIDGMGIDQLADYLCESEAKTIDFIEVYRAFIEENSAKKVIRNYKSALNSLVRFLGRERMDITEVTVPFLERYAAYLGSGRAASLYLGSMRHVYSYAKERYNDEASNKILIPYSPFSRYRVPRQNVAEKRAIDARAIKAIRDLPYDTTARGRDKENRYNLAKDCFILSFGLIGMNSADMFNACAYDEIGKKIVYYRTKTMDRRADRAKMEVEVSPCIADVFARYRDVTGERVFMFHKMYANPSTFNAALNKGLKAVGERVGIPRLEFYSARHSWATIARNDLGIDKYTINEALNHVDKDMSVTDLYIKKDFSEVNKANKMVLGYVFDKNI